MISLPQFRPIGTILLMLALIGTANPLYSQTKSATVNKQKLAELAADRMMKRFFETLQFQTIWKEFYVRNTRLRNLEVEAITWKLVRYRADGVSETRISMEARERAYVAQSDFWATLSAALFTSGNVPLDEEYARRYESITQRPSPYASSSELDRDFTMIMNQLSDANRKLVVVGNVGSLSYTER